LPFVAPLFVPFLEHEAPAVMAILLSLVVLVAGVLAAFALYRDQPSDSIRIPLFENRFYIDQFYNQLVRWTQDALAATSAFVDRWIIDGGIIRGLGGVTWGFGFALRFLQIGNLQAYVFLFGLGVVLLLYLVLFA
jgi:NADH-quinone oxidoreductase subunit L